MEIVGDFPVWKCSGGFKITIVTSIRNWGVCVYGCADVATVGAINYWMGLF